MHTQRKPTSSTGPRGKVDAKIWVPVVVVPPATLVRRSPPSLILARDAVEKQARVRKRTRPVDKGIGRSCVLGVPAELALLHPIENVLGWHVRGLLCLACRWKRRVAPFGAACKMEREIEKFIIRQPPMGEKDDYDSENSCARNQLIAHDAAELLHRHTDETAVSLPCPLASTPLCIGHSLIWHVILLNVLTFSTTHLAQQHQEVLLLRLQ